MNVLACRSMRRIIVDICECVYGQKYNLVYKYWDALEQEIMEAFPENERLHLILDEIRACMGQCNFLRVRDILTYEVDLFLFQQLNNLSQSEREYLVKEAKYQNEQALQTYHRDIWELLCAENGCTRIACDYSGTENVSISVLDKNVKYKLFSDTNPWLESSGYIDAMEVSGRISDEMNILGFGGGYVVEELQRRYPEMRIKVFLPNLDIFEAVLAHISLAHILQNDKLELYYEPIWLNFFTMKKEFMKAGSKVGAFIDRQELRACVGSAGAADQLMRYYNTGFREIMNADQIGEKIYRSIKGNLKYS